MTIRKLLMASMMSLVLGGCSISFLGTPTNSAPGNNYGYDWGGKPMSSVDYGQDNREKPLPRGSAQSANDDDEPTAKPTAPQRDEPVKPPVRKKPAPHRTKPTQPDAQPDPSDTPTRPSTDKPPTRRPIPIPSDSDSVDKPSPRRPVDRPTTKPDDSPRKKPQLVRHVQPKPTRPAR